MQCKNCAYLSEYDFKFCPNCGMPSEPQKPEESAEPVAYVRHDYDPSKNGYFPHKVPHPATHAIPDQVQAAVRPSTTGAIVLSIINIICFGFGIGFILGIVALIFAIMSSSEKDIAEAEKKISWARTCNYIGLALAILQLIVVMVLVVIFIRMIIKSGPLFGPDVFPHDFPLG